MKTIWFLTVGISIMTLTCVSAEIYRCKTPDGKLVMTDQKTELPDDCQPAKEPAGEGSFNIMPDSKDIEIKSGSEQPENKSTTVSPDHSHWQKQATTLVQNYKDAVQRRYHANLVANQRRAIQEIAGLKQQKQKMLDVLSGSGLTRAEQQAIRSILDEIPQK